MKTETRTFTLRGHRLEVARPSMVTLGRLISRLVWLQKKLVWLQKKPSSDRTITQGKFIQAEAESIQVEMVEACLKAWTSPEGFDLLAGRAPAAVRDSIAAMPGLTQRVFDECTPNRNAADGTR